jgi:hypothetical protein
MSPASRRSPWKVPLEVHGVVQDAQDRHAIVRRVVCVEHDVSRVTPRLLDVVSEDPGLSRGSRRATARRVLRDDNEGLFDEVRVLPVLSFSLSFERAFQMSSISAAACSVTENDAIG